MQLQTGRGTHEEYCIQIIQLQYRKWSEITTLGLWVRPQVVSPSWKMTVHPHILYIGKFSQHQSLLRSMIWTILVFVKDQFPWTNMSKRLSCETPSADACDGLPSGILTWKWKITAFDRTPWETSYKNIQGIWFSDPHVGTEKYPTFLIEQQPSRQLLNCGEPTWWLLRSRLPSRSWPSTR